MSSPLFTRNTLDTMAAQPVRRWGVAPDRPRQPADDCAGARLLR